MRILLKKSDRLDGLTILRFSKTFRSGGGVEQYLEDLDHILLVRNKIRIVRLFLEKESEVGKTTTKEIGLGSLVEIPLPVSVWPKQSRFNKQKIKQSRISFLKQQFRERIVYNPFLYRSFFHDYLKKYYPRPGLLEIRNAGEIIRRLKQDYNVDLLVMHHVGTVDSSKMIEEASKLGIPYIFINHFSNDSFSNVSIREQLEGAAGLAGVNGIGVPKRLRDHFCNLSDGIDIEKYDPVRARAVRIGTDMPIVIYPARIVRVKGQHDLINAYAMLRREGLRARIILAGRTDSPEYANELRELVNKHGLDEDILFVGQLNGEELRDWYGISSVLAFPTYHQEGLGRILVEAQAMKVPAVAYIIGGTPEGIQHEKTGFLVRKGDIPTFAKRLKELLKDEAKRKRMGEEGRKFVLENFSLEALADRHEQYYSRILSKIS